MSGFDLVANSLYLGGCTHPWALRLGSVDVVASVSGMTWLLASNQLVTNSATVKIWAFLLVILRSLDWMSHPINGGNPHLLTYILLTQTVISTI